MALDPVLDSVDGLADVLKKEYTKGEDGKWHLDVKESTVWKGTSGLLSALNEERTGHKTKLGEVKTLTSQIEALNTKIKELSGAGADDKVKAAVSQRESELIKLHEEEKKKLTEQLAKATKGMHKGFVLNELDAALTEEGGNPLLLRPVLEPFLRVTEDGENYRVEVLDSSGNVRVGGTKDGRSVPMSARQLVQEFKGNKAYAGAFSAGSQSGSGATGGSKTRTGAGPDLSKLSPQERLKEIRRLGLTDSATGGS